MHGGNEDLDAIAFLGELNSEVYRAHPDVQTFAEESTAFPGVSRPVHAGGLGFGAKWDMGWMHDTLEYLARDPIHRGHHHGEITFRSVYAWSEHFVLPLSHDEVVHGKGSLLTKMPGDRWQQLANLRLLLGMQYAQPGRKLLFMGTELAPEREWDHEAALDWSLLGRPDHAGVTAWLRDLNAAYRGLGALHEGDEDPGAFQWIEHDNAAISVFTFLRWSADGTPLLVAINATPVVRPDHRVGVPRPGRWTELLNSDAEIYGGSGVGNLGAVTARREDAHGFGHAVDAHGAAARHRVPRAGGRPQPANTVTLGATVDDDGSTHFRVWAPHCALVAVRLRPGTDATRDVALTLDDRGYHEGTVEDAPAGTRYVFVLDGDRVRSDPASRFQPDGPDGPSEVVDHRWPWRDADFHPPAPADLVLYELHVGTFTSEGTFDAVVPELRALHALGVTAIELMPIAQFPGRATGATTASPRSPPRRATAAPTGCAAWSTRRTAAASPWCSTSCTTISDPRATTSPTSARTSPTATGRHGGTPPTSTVRAATRCARSSSRAPSGGPRDATSTGCGSTRCTPSSMRAPPPSWASSRTRSTTRGHGTGARAS